MRKTVGLARLDQYSPLTKSQVILLDSAGGGQLKFRRYRFEIEGWIFFSDYDALVPLHSPQNYDFNSLMDIVFELLVNYRKCAYSGLEAFA